VAQIAWLDASPYVLAQPWDTLWHLLAYAALTLLAWIATGGRRPLAAPSAVLLAGACLADLATAAPAAVVTAGVLFFLQGNTHVRNRRRGRAA